MAEVIRESVLTCPFCGEKRKETMPTDACWFFYKCSHCERVFKPKRGDCCVFCSYGTVKCPPVQRAESGDAQTPPAA